MEVRTLRCEGASSNELDEGDEWAPTLAEHTVSTELGIPYGRRLLGGRSHRSSPSWGKPSTWRRVTGLEASEREGMRDAESRPEWMPRSGEPVVRPTAKSGVQYLILSSFTGSFDLSKKAKFVRKCAGQHRLSESP